MNIKKLGKTLAATVLGAAMSFSALAVSACENGSEPVVPTPPPSVEDPTKATITVNADKKIINAGTNESITVTATVTGLNDTSVVWSVEGNGAAYVNISQEGVLTLKQGIAPQYRVTVTVVATSAVSAIVKNSVNITVEPQVISGQVGELTTAMFTELGNAAITVTGEVTDVYDDLKNDSNDVQQKYDYKVMMSDGAWYGEWNRKDSKDKEISNYRRSTDTVEGSDSHTFNQVYIDKDNKIAQKPVTDYNSVPAIWENQHMWNHLGQMGNDIVNQWEYDAENNVYMYLFDNNSEDDLYFRTYLAFSLTPMLGNSDTLESIALTVENGKIVKMQASTSLIYQGGDKEGSSENATSLSYTLLTAEFSGVSDTAVPDPKPYERDFNGDKLAAAIEKMQGVTNYTFHAVEKMTSAPSYDDGDYSEYSVSLFRTSASNYKSATGTEGVLGQITEDAILLASTGKYSYSMDNNIYHTEYSGYKKIDDETYDYFEYSADLGALQGKAQYKGSIADILPKFEFSADVFEYAGATPEKVDGEWVNFHTFVLREPAITRDIAMQVSAHSYADDAVGSTHGTLKIIVSDDGNIRSVSYPFDLVSGTYLGNISTTFSKVGTTQLAEDTFEGYEARVIRDNWSQYMVMHYHANHSTQSAYDEIDAATLFTNIFGEKAANLPTPIAIYNAFGDRMSELFFNWKVEDNTATGGEKIYHDYVSMNAQLEKTDENGKITKAQHDEAISKIATELAKFNYAISNPNTGESGSTRYTTYISENGQGNIMIRIDNNGTRHFTITIMPVGMWTLKK